jgi:hypothetical protein
MCYYIEVLINEDSFITLIRTFNDRYLNYLSYKIKPVLRGHHWDKEKWPYKTGILLKEIQLI